MMSSTDTPDPDTLSLSQRLEKVAREKKCAEELYIQEVVQRELLSKDAAQQIKNLDMKVQQSERDFHACNERLKASENRVEERDRRIRQLETSCEEMTQKMAMQAQELSALRSHSVASPGTNSNPTPNNPHTNPNNPNNPTRHGQQLPIAVEVEASTASVSVSPMQGTSTMVADIAGVGLAEMEELSSAQRHLAGEIIYLNSELRDRTNTVQELERTIEGLRQDNDNLRLHSMNDTSDSFLRSRAQTTGKLVWIWTSYSLQVHSGVL
jgi:chromosome segregation ATPase